jgi:putative transposase
VCKRTVWLLMNQGGFYGLPGPTKVKRLRGVVTADDLVNREFHRLRPNEVWVTDITQHRTREGWIYCAAVLDAYSRRMVGWSIDTKQDATLVVNALVMAIRNRRPGARGIVHADHGTQFTSWVFGDEIRSASVPPSLDTLGDSPGTTPRWKASGPRCRSNFSIASSGRPESSSQTRSFEYIEIFHNRRRCHHTRLPHSNRVRTTLRDDSITAVS